MIRLWAPWCSMAVMGITCTYLPTKLFGPLCLFTVLAVALFFVSTPRFFDPMYIATRYNAFSPLLAAAVFIAIPMSGFLFALGEGLAGCITLGLSACAWGLIVLGCDGDKL